MRIQSAIALYLQATTSATYAICGVRSFWQIPTTKAAFPFNRIRKAGYQPIGLAIDSGSRTPAIAQIEIVSYAKSQEAAADLADATYTDLIAIVRQQIPVSSPQEALDPWVTRVMPSDEEDIVNEELREEGIFAEGRTYQVHYTYL